MDITSQLKLAKLTKLRDLLDAEKVSPAQLKTYAISNHGFVRNEIRTTTWLVLAGVELNSIAPKPERKKLERHKEYEQVLRDVDRSLKRFPPGLDEDERVAMHDQLVDVIMRVLVRNSDLHYYQGYHDLCVTFLIALGEDKAFAVMEKLSKTYLLEFMQPTMEPTTRLLQLIYVILDQEKPSLSALFREVQLEPYFALPWVITWFGHVLGDVDRILRIYDFFIATDPLMPIYMSVAIVLHRCEEVIKCEPDYAQLHHLLQNLPPDLPMEKLIMDSCRLFVLHPPKVILALRDSTPGLNTPNGSASTLAARRRASSLQLGWIRAKRRVSGYLSTCTRTRLLLTLSVLLVLLLAILCAPFMTSRGGSAQYVTAASIDRDMHLPNENSGDTTLS